MLDLLAQPARFSPGYASAGIAADREQCLLHVHNSTATLTALVERLGYEKVQHLAEHLQQTKGDTTQTLRKFVVEHDWLSAQEFEELTSPERVTRLGSPDGGSGARPLATE